MEETITSSSPADVPSADEVRGQLARILKSHRIRKTGVQRLLLLHLVERTLEADFAALSEPAIAIAVLGRYDFDSRTDPAVQLLAERLRKKLTEYYARHRNAKIRIELPKGSYIPVFSWRQPKSRKRARLLLAAITSGLVLAVSGYFVWLRQTAPKPRVYRSLAILPFDNVVQLPQMAPRVEEVTRRVADRLAQERRLRVLKATSADLAGFNGNVPALARRLAADALLAGSVYESDGTIRIVVQVADGRDGKMLWTDVYDDSPDLLGAMIADMGLAVTKALRPGGVR